MAGTSLDEDFKRLHRQYQFLEQNRKDYATDSANTIGRQQKIIEKLKKDNEYLKQEHRNYMRRPRGKATEAKIAELMDQCEIFDSKVEVSKRNEKELKTQISLVKDNILTRRRQMGGINAAKEGQAMIQKQVRILENRLDKALVKFNEALANNKKLRETIDNLRRERVVFDNIYRKLEKELHEKKKQMANVIEDSNRAYEARDKWQMELAAIEAQNEKERFEFEEQMDLLARQIEKDRMRKDVLSPADKRGDMTLEQEKNLKRNVTRSAWNVAKDKANVQVSVEKVQSYEEAFHKIKAATGIADIDELVTTFIANEDQNFSLFNYVSGQANEIEKLDETIALLRDEELKYQQRSGEDNSQHEQLRKELQNRLEMTVASKEKFELKFTEAQKTVNSLKVGIQSIFSKIDCTSSAMSEMLAGEAVTETNMMQYLGMIEQRTNEILQLWCVHNNKVCPLILIYVMTCSMFQKIYFVFWKSHSSYIYIYICFIISEYLKMQSESEMGGVSSSAPTSNAVASILGTGPPTPMLAREEKLRIAAPSMDEYGEMDGDDSDNEVDTMPHKLDTIKTEVLRYMSQKTVTSNPRGAPRGRGDGNTRAMRRKVF